jgi:serine/threonine protein kinase
MGACLSKTDPEPVSEKAKPAEEPKTEAPKQQQQQQQQQSQPEKPKAEEKKPEPKKEESEKEEEEEEEDLITIYEGIDEFYEMTEEVLGEGGYSIVKMAKDRATGEKVAVKIIDLDMIETDTAGVDPMLPLKREISIMQKINHPNIIKLYKVFIEDDKFCMVLELMPGGCELFKCIEDGGAMPEETAKRIFRDLVSAVAYLHNMGVAHRDLKPENVLVHGGEGKETIKLADFGFAKHFKEEQMKTALGSPAYAAPELFIAEKYDEKVDMWSLGVILYLLLSGIPPFFGESVKELTDRIINCDFDFSDPVWEKVSEPAKDCVLHLLVKDPAKRYSAQQLLDTKWMQGRNK